MIYQLFCLFIIPFGVSYFLSRKGKNRWGYILFSFYCCTILLNTFFYVIFRRSMLNIYEYDKIVVPLYIIGSILISYITHRIWNIHGKFQISIYKYSTLFTVLLFSNVLIYFLWLLGTSGRMTFELFYFSISRSVNTEVTGFYGKIGVLIGTMVFVSISIFYLFFKADKFTFIKLRKWKRNSKLQMLLAVFYPIIYLSFSVWLPFYTFHLEDAYTYFYSEDPFIEKHFVDPNTTTLTWPEQKRNLVYVFVESFESSYFSKDLGGMLEMNLLPNLTELLKEGVYFSDHKDAFGGAISMPQATNTISGIASTLSGINYRVPKGVDEEDISNTIPGSTNLNDLLKEQGYNEYFMIGMNWDDYGIGPYFKQHGDAKTVGLEEKIESGDLPFGYKEWWGFEDSKLYNFAKQDLTALSEEGNPFMYVISTNDTHTQDGYTDETCSNTYEYPMQNSIACTDQLLSDFLRWIMAQSFYKNTTIVVVGDHLGHKEKFVDTILPEEDRRVFNLILNSVSNESDGIHEVRKFWAGDMFPTVLSAMGVKIEGERLGLGTNLFSKEPTLLEIYGEDYVHDALEKNSEFYLEHFSKVKEEE